MTMSSASSQPETPTQRLERLRRTLDHWEAKPGRHASEQATKYRRLVIAAVKHTDATQTERGERIDAGWSADAIRRWEQTERLGVADCRPDRA